MSWVLRLAAVKGILVSGIKKVLSENRKDKILERETGFEPATSTLARLHSTAELLPHIMEAAPRFELGVKALQASALPLGDAAKFICLFFCLERETGFEPATSTLARLHSTAELLPR